MSDINKCFFICGTPSNLGGFQYVALDGGALPSQVLPYLDINLNESSRQQGNSIHKFIRESTDDGRDLAIYSEYRSIHPNDTESNRGAYIAVGCWSFESLHPLQAVAAIRRIQEIHIDLEGLRNSENNSFPPDFKLDKYRTSSGVGMDILAQLANVFYQSTSVEGIWKEEYGQLSVTSEEIFEGKLDQFYRATLTENQIHSNSETRSKVQNRIDQIEEFVQNAMREFPESRTHLRNLIRLEKKRSKIIGLLNSNFSKQKRHSRHSTGVYYRIFKQLSVWQILLISTIAITFGVAVVTTAILFSD